MLLREQRNTRGLVWLLSIWIDLPFGPSLPPRPQGPIKLLIVWILHGSEKLTWSAICPLSLKCTDSVCLSLLKDEGSSGCITWQLMVKTAPCGLNTLINFCIVFKLFLSRNPTLNCTGYISNSTILILSSISGCNLNFLWVLISMVELIQNPVQFIFGTKAKLYSLYSCCHLVLVEYNFFVVAVLL